MRLGLGSWSYTWAIGVPGHPPSDPLTAVGLLSRAADLGVHVVQICDNLPLHVLSERELAELQRHAQRLGVQIEVGTRGIACEHLERYLHLAVALQSPILRLVVDTADDCPSDDEIIARLRQVLPSFQHAGVRLAIENHDRLPTGALLHILHAIDSEWVGICLDTVNSFGALQGPEVVVRALAPWAVNLHVKDFAVTRHASQMGFTIEGRPAGQGRLDVPWLLDVVRVQGRAPNAILELWTPFERDLDTTICKESTWAAQSVEYMRSLILD